MNEWLTDRWDEGCVESILWESKQDTSLANTRVSDQKQLEQIVVCFGHFLGLKILKRQVMEDLFKKVTRKKDVTRMMLTLISGSCQIPWLADATSWQYWRFKKCTDNLFLMNNSNNDVANECISPNRTGLLSEIRSPTGNYSRWTE